MPHRKHLSIEARNALEREAIALGKQKGYDRRGSVLVGYVAGWMDAALLHLEPQPKAALKEPRRPELEAVK